MSQWQGNCFFTRGLLLRSLLFVLFLLSSHVAWSADTLKGVALVIGNGDYENLSDLPNPVKDADDFKKLFVGLGFKTVSTTDRDLRRLQRDIEDFVYDAEGADVAVLSYSGHGIEAGGENWLVPVDADISALDEAGEKLVPLSDIVKRLQAKVPIVVVLLDACRNNPFPVGATLKPAPGGAPVPIAPSGLGESRSVVPFGGKTDDGRDNLGTIVGFAAAPGKTALDGAAGTNSPYAAAMLKHLDAMAGTEFGVVMRMVTEEVYLKTGGKQRPWTNESLRRLLYFGKAPEPTEGDEGAILKDRRQLLVAIAALPSPERRQAERVARDGGVPLDVVYGMLNALGADAPDDPAQLEKVLRTEAERFAKTLAERNAINSPDPEIMRLSALADTAESEGLLARADELRERTKARFRDLQPTLEKDQEALRQRFIEGAAVFARSAETKQLSFDHAKAAEDYRQAFELVEHWDDELAFRYTLARGKTLTDLGSLRGSPGSLEAAILVLEQAERMRPIDSHPDDWASARIKRAIAVHTLGESQAGAAGLDQLRHALELYVELTKTAWTREHDPINWAVAISNVADLASDIGDRSGSAAHYDRARELYEAVLEVFRRDTHPLDWADNQAALGMIYRSLAEAEHAPHLLTEAEERLHSAQEVRTREEYPFEWAGFEANRGLVLDERGVLEGDADLIREAAEALESALAETPREKYPLRWGTIQNGIGVAYGHLADLAPNFDDLARSESAHLLALEVRTKDAAPLDRATTNYNLAGTLTDLGRLTHGREYFARAIRHYREALDVLDAEGSPEYYGRALQMLTNPVNELFEIEKTPENARQAVEAYRQLLDLFDVDSAPSAWARYANNAAYTMVEAALVTGDFSQVPEAIGMLDRAVEILEALGHEKMALNTQDSLCFALVELADSGGDRSALPRAISTCEQVAARSRSAGQDTGDVDELLRRALALQARADR